MKSREDLVLKGVKGIVYEREFALNVESLKEHFPEVEFHESDTFDVKSEEGDEVEFHTYVKHRDVINFGKEAKLEKIDILNLGDIKLPTREEIEASMKNIPIKEMHPIVDGVIHHVITKEDLDLNPELEDNGVKVGDEVTFDAEEAEVVEEPVVKTPKKKKAAAKK